MMSEVQAPYLHFQNFFGMAPNGPNTVKSETRSVSYDIVNDDRTVSQFTAPGSDAATIPPMVIGNRLTTAPRSFERMDLSYEVRNNIRALGKNSDPGSQAAMSYVKQQMGHMARRTARFREFMIWGALKGACSFSISGTDWVPKAGTTGDVDLSWQIPATNLNQLDGIIGASWSTASTEIITDLGQITAASESLTGLPIRHAWVNQSRWIKILNNDQVKAMGGTANTAFESWIVEQAQTAAYGPGGTGINSTKYASTGVLKGFPGITFHVTDAVIKLDGTVTKYLGDDDAIFHPEPSSEWFWMWEIKESTNQNGGQPPVDVYGSGSWVKFPHDADVPKYHLYSLDNCMPAMNPNAVFFADLVP
jgi:hypothetical protein